MLQLPKAHPLRWIDDRLGIGHIHGLGLNWKGRLIERIWLTKSILTPQLGHPVRWLDDKLGIGHIHSDNLNWRGRAIERAKALGGHPVIRFDDRLGLGHIHSSRLNRKGRMLERAMAVRRWVAIRRRIADGVSLLINSLAFTVYRVFDSSRRRTAVTSVLQISILSHKPYMISRALRAEGLKSDCFMLNVGMGEGILNVGWDYAMPANLSPLKRWLLEHYYLWTVLARYDVIHSHFKTFLSHNGWELRYLQRLGKVLVFHSRGCDVRHRSLNMRLQPELNCCQECEYPEGSCDTDYQRQQVGIMRKYGTLFFVTTPDLLDFVPGSEHVPFIHPVGVNFESIVPAVRQDESVFRVVTSSNHHGVDGTRFIRAAVERLQREGKAIELIEVNQMAYHAALAVYKSADVYVGKLRMGYYNNANIETMMLGVPNMSYIRDDFRGIAPDCPIIVTTPNTVYDRLAYYIDRRDELRAIGARGPAFVRTHHDPQQIVRHLIARYNEAKRAAGSSPAQDQAPRTLPLLRSDGTPLSNPPSH
jgi:hypothetical protein